MTRLVQVYRYDPAGGRVEGDFRPYEVETTPGMSVMDVLDYIHSHLDSSLSYYSHSACLHGICGRCFVKVNGKSVLACETPLPDEGDVVIGPARKDRVLKDLVTKPPGRSKGRQGMRNPGTALVTDADHFVVLAGNQEAVVAAYRDTLGFSLQYGGRNEAVGYENHLIGFGLIYLEILSLLDWESGLADGLIARELADRFEGRRALCLTYAVRTDNLEELTHRIAQGGMEAIGPLAMERKRPDGNIPRWRLSLPGGIAFRRAHIPFLIEWMTDDGERLSWEEPVSHPNGAVTVSGFRIAVKDLNAARQFYEDTLGCQLLAIFDRQGANARCARYRIGGVAVDLVSPAGDGPVKRCIESVGDGPYEIRFAVEDINKTAAFLRRRQVRVEQAGDDETGLLVDDLPSFGIRIGFTEQGAQGRLSA